LKPHKDACEKKTVTHYFQVCLGECKVTRNVKITHCITANLNHHIEENVICKHEPCTKYTSEERETVNNGKCCNVKFPECEKDIVFVDDKKQHDDNDSEHSEHSRHENKNKKHKRRKKHH
jgi:hypothetical protein